SPDTSHVYVDIPQIPHSIIHPVLPLLHKTDVTELLVFITAICLILWYALFPYTTLFRSVIVYEPEARPVKIPVVAPVAFTVGPATAELTGEVQPFPKPVIQPLLPPLHKTAAKELFTVNAVGCVMDCDVVTVQLLASVTVI